MAKRYGLIYGDDYEKRQYWNQFVTVLEQSRGRRNHIIFMIITALIKELGLSDCNDLIMINALERWAYDRLSGSGETKTVCVTDHEVARAPTIQKPSEASSSTTPQASFDVSMFSGMNRTTSLSDI